MADLVQMLIPLIVVMGLVSALAVLLSGGGSGATLAVLLDFLLAAGLLRLSQAQTWAAIITAALTTLVRKLAVAGLSPRAPGRRPGGRRPGTAAPGEWDQGRTR
ncbi:hypothetical protein ACSDR0_08800 [Streptosporangium sp. G11]|uniref:hypothetical protein n=1 Tax=Streptosporangium sp. G11 TaxID=3436926 RepID=UPI003EBDA78D